MAGNEDIDTPPPQDISNVLAAADLSSHSSYDTVKYKRAWHRAKGIRSSILSSGGSPDAQSRALSIALDHIEIASIMAVTGTILPKRYANEITRNEQKKKILSHATSIAKNKNKQRTEKLFHIQYCVHCVISIKENRSK